MKGEKNELSGDLTTNPLSFSSKVMKIEFCAWFSLVLCGDFGGVFLKQKQKLHLRLHGRCL